MKTLSTLGTNGSLTFSAISSADITIPMYALTPSSNDKQVGTVIESKSKYGVAFTPKLSKLTPRFHGFHVHQNGSCGPAKKEEKIIPGGTAGGHFDPKKTGKHDTPWGDGHLGDLPPIYVSAEGNADQPVLAPRLKLKHLKGKSLMVHADGDNHSDHPAKLGGGGPRVACGVINISKK